MFTTGGQCEAASNLVGTTSEKAESLANVVGNATTRFDDAIATGANFTVTGGSWNVIYGGYSGSGDVTSNTVTLTDADVTSGDGKVYGGCADSSGEASNNTVNLYGANKINNLYGGAGATSTGNTLNVYSCGNETKTIAAFQKMNFYIPAEAANGSTMLKVKNSASMGNAVVSATVSNSNNKLQVGNYVNLIKVVHVTQTISGTYSTGKLSAGGYGNFDLEIVTTEDKKAIQAKILGKSAGGDENSKSPVETRAAAMSILNSGADLLAGAGFVSANEAVAADSAAGGSIATMTPYVAVGGQKTRVESGSYCDVTSWNINAGFAKKIKNQNGELLVGPVVEYGRGSYDSYLDNGTNGDGDSQYLGLGVIAKQTNNDGLYYEGSLRGGRTKSDYKAISGEIAGDSYDSSATYWALHLGVGKVQKLSETDSLDYYGKVFFSYQGGDSITTSRGTNFDFDATKSFRTRLGFRYNHDMNKAGIIYAGLAWQHEFDGTADAHVTLLGDSYSTPSPSIKGDTGILELGWKMKGEGNFETDLGVIGSVGKQRGIGLNARFSWAF